MKKWKIFYDDDSTFSSDDGSPEEAPSEGFICAIGYDESDRRYIMNGWDFYGWDVENEQWWGCDLPGLFDRLRRNKVHAYKEGRTVTRSKFHEIVQRAHQDPDYPM